MVYVIKERTMPPEDNSSKLISDVLEKMIDSQVANTHALTSLQGTMETVNDRLQNVEHFFTNGFRDDIKLLINASNLNREEQILLIAALKKLEERQQTCPVYHEEFEKQLTNECDKLGRKVESYKRFGFWFKVIAGFLASIGVIVASIVAVIKLLG